LYVCALEKTRHERNVIFQYESQKNNLFGPRELSIQLSKTVEKKNTLLRHNIFFFGLTTDEYERLGAVLYSWATCN
jgi:hypothetical protein